MKENERIKKDVLLISAFADTLAKIECTQEEIEDDLRKEEVNLEASMSRLKIFLRLQSIGTEKARNVRGEGTSIIDKIADWSKDKIIHKISELSSGPAAVYGATCKGLEDKSIEDLSSLLKELEIVVQKKKEGSN